MPTNDIQQSFPGLQATSFRVTSPPDTAYNCVAWAVEDPARWWDPADEHGYYWPTGVRRELSLTNLIAALATMGFEECENAALELGFQKAAIYSDHGWPTHVARQLASGAWTSKLGVSEDIEHATLEGLEGAIYGRVVRVLKRRVAKQG